MLYMHVTRRILPIIALYVYIYIMMLGEVYMMCVCFVYTTFELVAEFSQ